MPHKVKMYAQEHWTDRKSAAASVSPPENTDLRFCGSVRDHMILTRRSGGLIL